MPFFKCAVRRPIYMLSLPAAMLAVLLLSSCASRENEILTDACVKAGHSASGLVDQTLLNTQCQCSALAAKRYLDPDDYKLLVSVAEIYSENTSDSEKLQKLIVGMIGSGLTASKASIAAIDMISLAHKVAGECKIGGHNNV